jgi:LmbE family N-acetylglucosaminyl deacetylase
MKKVLVVAPHPDDETLGCGGTILRYISEGDLVFWLIATTIKDSGSTGERRKERRNLQVSKVNKAYGFDKKYELKLEATQLDTLPKSFIINKISKVISKIEPEIIYVPYRLDAHSDHEVIYDCTIACTKSFRYPFIKRVMIYQTLSETEFGLRPEDPGFKPNSFVDISSFLKKKIEILKIYDTEINSHPFPRSVSAVKAQATLWGSYVNCKYAEAFITLKEII